MDVDARVSALQAENERLQQRIDQLEDVMGITFVTPFEWRLTSSERCVMGVLLKRDVATKDAIMAALYRAGGRDDEPEIKIVDVFICKMRKKLKPFSLVIETHWGAGYSLVDRRAIAERIGAPA